MNETKTNLTLKQRQRMQGKVQSAQKPTKGQGNGKEISRIVAILLLLLAFGGGTALGMIYFRTDPRLQEIEDMQAIANDEFTPADVRGQLMGQSWEQAGDLPANLRKQIGMGQDRGASRIAKFFAMSSADQLAQLQRDVAREKEREAMRAEMEQAAAANPTDASQANSGNNNSNDNSNSKGGGGRKGMTDQQRAQRMEQRLSSTSPQQRSQGTLYRQMRNSLK